MALTELFSPLEFDVVWQLAEIGELPYPLQVHSHGSTMDERASLIRQTAQGLEIRGLVDDQGQLATNLASLLKVLARSKFSVDTLQITAVHAHPLVAVAATDGEIGALMVHDDRGFQLSEVPVDGVVGAIVNLLPAAGRGTEKSITVPVESVAAVGVQHSRAADDLRVLAQLNAQPRLRGGQIGVNARAHLGGGAREILSWFDTDSGRYLTQASSGGDGRDWITIAPTDSRNLRHRLGEMLSAAQKKCS